MTVGRPPLLFVRFLVRSHLYYPEKRLVPWLLFFVLSSTDDDGTHAAPVRFDRSILGEKTREHHPIEPERGKRDVEENDKWKLESWNEE